MIVACTLIMSVFRSKTLDVLEQAWATYVCIQYRRLYAACGHAVARGNYMHCGECNVRIIAPGQMTLYVVQQHLLQAEWTTQKCFSSYVAKIIRVEPLVHGCKIMDALGRQVHPHNSQTNS